MIDESEATELFKEYRRTGDIELRNRLVENYFHIAEILAKKFSGRGVEYDDLLQVASEALITGVEKFEPELGNRFTTYVTPTITGMIKNYFRDYSRAVRLPRRVYAVSTKVKKAVAEYFQKYGKKPTVKQLSEELDLPEEQIMEAMEFRAPVSLDASVSNGDGESDAPLYEVIDSGENAFEKFEDAESLKAELKKLDPIEKKVVALRFSDGKSQAEVGKILGVSQMFVSRAEKRIVEKLKDALL